MMKINDDRLKERESKNIVYNLFDLPWTKNRNFILFWKCIWYFYLRINSTQCLHDANSTGDWLTLSLSIKFTDECRTPYCQEAFIVTVQEKISNLYYNIKLSIKFTDGQTIDVKLSLCSYEQVSTGKAFNHLYKIE
jgi:hypothetical protein